LGQDRKTAPLSKQKFALARGPEFKGVAARFFSNPVSMGGNAETFMNIGVGMEKAVIELLQE